jgi:uncharacterized protein
MQINLSPGRRIMGRLAKGGDLLGALEKYCQELNITLGEVTAIGAVTKARVGYYDQAAQKYQFLEFNQPLEIISLMGNVSLKDGKPFVHAHITLGGDKGQALGGHLAEGTIVFAGEFILQEYHSDQTLVRQLDKATGLFLWA